MIATTMPTTGDYRTITLTSRSGQVTTFYEAIYAGPVRGAR